jgi:acyl-CoA synthetase (AMP-forming)/AMP-acid ligase II
MIHMRTYLPTDAPQKLKYLLTRSKLKQQELSQAVFVTKDTVLDYLKRQLEKGNWQTVQEVLKGKPMTKAGKFMLSELRNRIATSLIMRLGFRKVIAVGIAIVLLPLILAKYGGVLIGMMQNKSENQ